jgi:hypothetical protein
MPMYEMGNPERTVLAPPRQTTASPAATSAIPTTERVDSPSACRNAEPAASAGTAAHHGRSYLSYAQKAR